MNARLRGWLLPALAAAFPAGILLGRAAPSWVPGAAGALLALCTLLLLRDRGRFCAWLVLALTLGCLRGWFAYHPALPEEGACQISGIVTEEVELRSGIQVRTALSGVTLDGAPLAGGAYWSFHAPEIPEGLVPGTEVSFRGRVYHPSGPANPDGYDFREELLRRGIRIGVYGAEELETRAPASFSLPGFAASLRHRLTERLCASPLGEEAGAYAAALLLGNRSLLPRADRQAFSRLGIAHILSVSGFHVGVLIAVLALFFRLLRLPQGVRLTLYAALLGFYALLCGGAPPVVRASLLLLLAHRGRMLARPRSLLHLLCAALLIQLALSPVQLTGLSFQLSFGAVFGLALITPYLSGLIPPRRRILRRLGDALFAGIGAQLGILLPQLYAFQELPLLSLLLNLPVLTFAAGLILLDWAALLSLAVPAVSGPVCGAARWATEGLLSAVRTLGGLPGIALWTRAADAFTAAGVLLLFAGLCCLLRWKGRSRLLLSCGGLLLLALSLLPRPHGTTEYLQFSVGDADAALLWDRDQALVLDTGYEDGAVSDYLRRRRLTPSAVILTHLHADHAGGLRALREDRIPVPVIYLPVGAEEADIHPDMRLLLEEYRAAGTEIRHLAAGDVLPLPSGEIRVLWPETGGPRPGQDANESSLALLLRLQGTTLLQTGDLDGRYEMYAAVPADILKVAHHGSVRSSSEAFLRAVAPRVVLLSGGDPDRAEAFAARLPETADLYATARQGMLTLRFGAAGQYSVETFLSPRKEETP